MRHLSIAAALLAASSCSAIMSGCVSPQLAAAQAAAQKDAADAKAKEARLTSTDGPLFKASLSNNKDEILRALADEEIRSGNPEGRELVLAIVQRRKADALRLIEIGADVNAAIINTPFGMYDGLAPLSLAAWTDELDLIKTLGAKGANLDEETRPAIIQAQNAATVKLLLDLGSPVDKEYKDGVTPLAVHAIAGKTDIVRLLISRGADVEKTRSYLERKIPVYEQYSATNVGFRQMVSQHKGAISFLERMNKPAAVSQTAAPGVTKDELKQMMKEAAAENSRPAVAPVAAAEYKSDVDAPAYKASQNPDAFALVVGVEKYNTLPDARFAERDAKAMNAHLLAMGYPQRNIVLLTGSQATKTGLIKNLEAWLPNNVTEKSTVMFYFSGHGAPDAKTSQAYLVPMDGDPQYLEETAYPIKRLYAKLAALKAKRVLVALDSCFSGSGGRSVLALGTRPLVAKLQLAPVEEKVVSLSASSSDEITGALEEQGHGLFTYHLLKALTETAGRGTVAEVYASLKPRVQDEARRQNRAQTPQAFGRALDGGLR